MTDGTYTPVIEESDTGAFAGEETAVADADLLGTEAAAAFAAADDTGMSTTPTGARVKAFTRQLREGFSARISVR